jgi:hypothetical protein
MVETTRSEIKKLEKKALPISNSMFTRFWKVQLFFFPILFIYTGNGNMIWVPIEPDRPSGLTTLLMTTNIPEE